MKVKSNTPGIGDWTMEHRSSSPDGVWHNFFVTYGRGKGKDNRRLRLTLGYNITEDRFSQNPPTQRLVQESPDFMEIMDAAIKWAESL